MDDQQYSAPPQDRTPSAEPGAFEQTFEPEERPAPPPPPPPTPPTPPPPPPPSFYAPAAPPPRKKGANWGLFLGGAVLGCGCLPLVAFLLFSASIGALMGSGSSSGVGPSRDSVAVIDVSGVITSGELTRSPFGSSGADAQYIIEQLEKTRTNRHIKAVVLWINSPGGSAAGSDAVYTEVQKVRTSGKKVVVAMGDVAASGGYYIASAADRIYANGATLTGSIGVISEIPNYSNPNSWAKKSGLMDAEVIKSGKFKDMGNPMRPMTREERALFQQMVDDIYGQFLNAVSKARRIPVATLRPLADGRVYTGRQAVKNGLVDEIGNLRDAISYAGEQAHLGPDPMVHKMGGSSLSDFLTGTETMYQGASLPSRLRGLLLMDPRAAAMAGHLAEQP
ncbi:MAG TPA: signal peptide peptidase SppA [Armatimonadota bacterium]